mmetsp:Transcript_43329/g.114042  ORF Transcript_43329/g.114042 Transcript_43329/m.114042 type:complete len:202 (-) Transcript_43329:463-1068(-)
MPRRGSKCHPTLRAIRPRTSRGGSSTGCIARRQSCWPILRCLLLISRLPRLIFWRDPWCQTLDRWMLHLLRGRYTRLVHTLCQLRVLCQRESAALRMTLPQKQSKSTRGTAEGQPRQTRGRRGPTERPRPDRGHLAHQSGGAWPGHGLEGGEASALSVAAQAMTSAWHMPGMARALGECTADGVGQSQRPNSRNSSENNRD